MKRHYYLLQLLVYGAPVDEQCNIKRMIEHSCLPNHMDIKLKTRATECLDESDDYVYRVFLKRNDQVCPVFNEAHLVSWLHLNKL